MGSQSWDNLALLLSRRLSSAALERLSLDLYIPTLEDLHACEAHFQAGLDDILTKDAFSRLQVVTVWLRAAPPSVMPLELVGAMELCKPALPSGCVFHVRPWWDLGLGRHSA